MTGNEALLELMTPIQACGGGIFIGFKIEVQDCHLKIQILLVIATLFQTQQRLVVV